MALHIEIDPDWCPQNKNMLAFSIHKIWSSISISDIFNKGLEVFSCSNLKSSIIFSSIKIIILSLSKTLKGSFFTSQE